MEWTDDTIAAKTAAMTGRTGEETGATVGSDHLERRGGRYRNVPPRDLFRARRPVFMVQVPGVDEFRSPRPLEEVAR
jgi:hypothetical protein